MNEYKENGERTVIAYAEEAKRNNPSHGFVRPIAEIVNGKIVPVEPSSFCQTMKVFITTGYDDLERKFPNKKLFELRVGVSVFKEDVNPEIACKYVAKGEYAKALAYKEYFELFDCDKLPPADNRTLVLDSYPGTEYIYLRQEDDFVFGPFKWSDKRKSEQEIPYIQIDFVGDRPLPNVKLASYQTYQIGFDKVKTYSVDLLVSASANYKRTLIHGTNFLSGADYFDYASDEEVIRFCAKQSSANKLINKSDLEKLANYLQTHTTSSQKLFRERIDRLRHLGEVLSFCEDTAAELDSFFRSERGRDLFEKYIDNELGRVRLDKKFEEYKKTREADLQTSLDEKSVLAEKRIKELNIKKDELNNDVQRLHTEIRELEDKKKQDSELEKLSLQFDAGLQEKQSDLLKLDEQIKGLLAKHEQLKNLDNITSEIEYQKRKLEDEKREQQKIETTTAELRSLLSKADTDLQKKLTELRPFVEAINGSFSIQHQDNVDIQCKTHTFSSQSNHVQSQETVITSIQGALKKQKRHLPIWQIANLLISTQQSFITVLAGLPGAGKTTLARLLASSQNISHRLHEIPVARGWTSQKDLLGFYNPLSQRFQSSNTGLYPYLKKVGAEKDDVAMAYVLLDEANLSPIEHYWSVFMGLTDADTTDRKLRLASEEPLNIPDHLRFIATINYDATTEPLSMRFIDRAPIVLLDMPSEAEDSEVDELPTLPIAANEMRKLFGLINDPNLEPEEARLYEGIKEKLRNDLRGQVVINPRKDAAIRQYCHQARGLLSQEKDSDLAALDLVIQQHILPLIRGSGKAYGDGLKKLRDYLQTNELSDAAKRLDQIIVAGDGDLDTYDFFCW